MEPALDPFQPLLKVVDRYKHDVHELRPPASNDLIERVTAHLGGSLPGDLVAFLERWNGATLFRGALRIRAASEFAIADERAPDVVVFGDGPLPNDRWAFAPDGAGGSVFGRWRASQTEGGDECGVFEPLHERFDRWLSSTLRILDENLREPGEKLAARLDCDPGCGYLIYRDAEIALAGGDPVRARDLLRKATAADPALVPAWERLGDSLMGEDQASARWAYMKALRALRLPAPYPTTDAPGPALLRTLSRLFPVGDPGWGEELERFLSESVRDASTFAELALVEAAAVELARGLLARGDRQGAHDALVDLLDRARAFRVHGPCAEAVLLLVSVDTELGHHDDAERHLRSLRFSPPPIAARALLALGRIAVMRQEPWAEEILDQALGGLLDPVDRCEVLLLSGERHTLRERHEAAGQAFGEAHKLAEQAGDRGLQARAEMGLGDLARQQGDGAGAEAHYREARLLAGDEAELLMRVVLRRGDLYRLMGDILAAKADYVQAATGFDELGLPIRAAWARLRLGQLGDDEAVNQARTRFRAADLAAGVAAADAIGGSPAASLDWHLERAAEHSRDRANAQRARPPLGRPDADRPERRIGAHRMAIAAGSVAVVHRLGVELDQRVRAVDLNAARMSDPNLSRYVAAADLLAAHRGYEAAETMLHHLLEARPSGIAGRALVGVMARSPNAALVDGLLGALENGCDPGGMAAAAEVLGWRREVAAVDVLRRLAQEGGHPTVRKAAIVSLGRIGHPSAIDDLLPALQTPELAEETSVALLLLGEWAGVDYQAQALASRQPNLSKTLGEIVGRYGGPSYLLLLLGTADAEGPAGIGALQGLGYHGDPRVVPRLIDATAGRDPVRARVASAALEIITGQSEDPEEALLRGRWLEFWEKNSDRFKSGMRYRHGRLVDPGLLVARLSHDDSLVRRSTYDELVISTGERLSFDADGPYRVQVANQSAWAAWWQAHSAEFSPGHWSFFGEPLG